MNNNFRKTFRNYSNSKAKLETELSGTLGIYLEGEQLVDVLNRPGFVYVQLRDNLSEVIQVFNEKVSAKFGLPVIVIRQGNRYYIKGRDTERYNNWGTSSSFVPIHANQHAFNPDGGGGGDILWVQGRQMLPLSVYPSGTKGANGVLLYPYEYRKDDGDIVSYGATGTGNIIQYRPLDTTALMGIVYINTVTGNPEFIINSGTPFLASITGTQDVVRYLPDVTDNNYLLLASIRLVSGTTSIGWDNIYDLRQWYSTSATTPETNIQDEGVPKGSVGTLNFVGNPVDVSVSGSVARVFITGSAGGGGGTPGGADTQVQFNNSGVFDGDTGFIWHKDIKNLSVGEATLPIFSSNNKINTVGVTGTAGFLAWNASNIADYGGYLGAFRARGDWTTPTAVQNGDNLLRIRGWGHDDVGIGGPTAEIRFNAVGDYSTSSHGSEIELWVTPTGTVTKKQIVEVTETGINIPTGTSYNVGGIEVKTDPNPHANTHTDGTDDIQNATSSQKGLATAAQITKLDSLREILTADRTYYVSTTGSDSNDGLTSGNAFATIQKAIDTIAELDVNEKDVTVSVADGTYTGLSTITLINTVGGGTVTIQGNTTTPTSVSMTFLSANDGFYLDNVAGYKIEGLYLIGTGSNKSAINVENGSKLKLGNITFGAGWQRHQRMFNNTIVEFTAGYTISGSATNHIYLYGGATLHYPFSVTATITVSGTPAFSDAFASVNDVSWWLIYAPTWIFSGSATGKRYDVTGNARLNTATGGISYLPGNAAGTTATGGQYT